MRRCSQVPFVALCFVIGLFTHVQGQTFVYPGVTWEKADPRELGWSIQKLEEARQYLRTVPEGSVVVVDRGRVIAEWGDPAKRIKLSSARKSILSSLYGTYAHRGRLDLSKTLDQLGIDDDPPLTPAEKQATVRMLLQARSGIYHAFVAGTPAMRAAMPARGSHAPGTFWYYNNWDFNALGTIFEKQTKTDIGSAFRDLIARPTQMQDFRPEDFFYVRTATGDKVEKTSSHAAYHFRMTARDAARFGYLFLRQGSWKGAEVIPAEWVKESTTSYSDTGNGVGYGYLWWVNWPGVPVTNYSAQGALGKYIVVFPDKDLVVVYLNHTDYPDDASAIPAAELKKLPNMTREQMARLLQLILEAKL
jgi:CubicO group peptidase (beta-lactamase class C family)